MFRNEIQKFRHRGYQVSQDVTEPIVMMFGDDPEPVSKDGSPVKKLWDNDIEQVIIVKPHVEPTPAS
jgi:hypothetical protein